MKIDKPSSPFFFRNYGGYSEKQKVFYEDVIDSSKQTNILDPMSGQGYYLSDYSRKGISVWLGDINPALVILANLRDPYLLFKRDEVKKFAYSYLDKESKKFKRSHLQNTYVDGWLAKPINDEILKFSEKNQSQKKWESKNNQTFWDLDPFERFLLSLPILAARDIVSFHPSDNKTWLKPGGLLREPNIYEVLKRVTNQWHFYASQISKTQKTTSNVDNLKLLLNCSVMDAEKGNFGNCTSPNIIVTSPPYANRLDYTKMWYPEILIASLLFGINISDIKNIQIGSNVVRDKHIMIDEVDLIPNEIISILKDIQSDNNSKSSSYYYHFFCNYALSLSKSMKNISQFLEEDGILIVFVRDTVRKDILFPTAKLIKNVVENYGLSIIRENKKIIRSHIGLLRRSNSQPGIYGMAQQEWWLVFKK